MFLLHDRKIFRLLSKHTRVHPITRYSRLREDLGLSEEALADVMMDIEALFEISIRDADCDAWITVRDLQFGVKRICKQGE